MFGTASNAIAKSVPMAMVIVIMKGLVKEWNSIASLKRTWLMFGRRSGMRLYILGLRFKDFVVRADR